MADEYKEVEAILGPYRGQRLTMTVADADAAVNDHWARDPYAEPAPGEGTRANEVRAPRAEGKEGEAEAEQQHTEGQPLTEEERTHAIEAADAWAKAQWDKAAGIEPPPDPPPPEGETAGTARRPPETETPHQRRQREQRERALQAENPEAYKTR